MCFCYILFLNKNKTNMQNRDDRDAISLSIWSFKLLMLLDPLCSLHNDGWRTNHHLNFDADLSTVIIQMRLSEDWQERAGCHIGDSHYSVIPCPKQRQNFNDALWVCVLCCSANRCKTGVQFFLKSSFIQLSLGNSFKTNKNANQKPCFRGKRKH